jgi:hypothetical protein
MVVLAKRNAVGNWVHEDSLAPAAADSWGSASSPPTEAASRVTHATKAQRCVKRFLMVSSR